MYLQKINLKNKYALVTGAGKGLGRACSIALAEAGATVIALSRTQSDLNKLEKDIKKIKGKVIKIQCDVMNYQDLKEKFGNERVFDTPTSENAMTGVGIGLAMKGYFPIMIHQRFDFFLLAMDQLVNGAAKWYYMFGGQKSIPITIRLIVGRGWGQGPNHSQSLETIFSHIPGLKVIAPTFPKDAKGMVVSAIRDKNPVIIIEHRWCHYLEDE